MKKLWILVALVFLVGCGPTANQLKLGQAYYQAMAARQANPYVEIKIADPTKPTNIELIRVWGPEQGLAQYQERDYAAPWINLTSSVLSVAVPWIGAAAIVGSMKDIAGNSTTNYMQNVSGTNNTGRIAGPTQIQANVAGSYNTLGGGVEQSIPTTTTTNTTTTTTPSASTTTGDASVAP
jgi:hypothetical protein